MISVQNLLVRGKREEAVDAAVASGDFAMALLVASMCSRKTYQRVARQYADGILLDGTPLHTVALLFSGQLHAPSKEGLEKSKSSFWGGDTVELTRSWRSHLAAIISNRTNGWDVIVIALGDRLRDLGEIIPAHFCYMVAGCPVGSPGRPDCRLSLIGISMKPSDITLKTDDSVEAFERTEAYEWAKRRGNVNAAIQSLQPFKLTYAIQLADHGHESTALRYAESIETCMGIRTDEMAKAPAFSGPIEVAVVSPKRDVIVASVRDFKSRFHPHPSNVPDLVAGEVDADISFLTAQSNLTEALPSAQARTDTGTAMSSKVEQPHRNSSRQRGGKKAVASELKAGPPLNAITEEKPRPTEQTFPVTQKADPKIPSAQPPTSLPVGQPASAERKMAPRLSPSKHPSADLPVGPPTDTSKPPAPTATPVRSSAKRERAPISAPAQLEQQSKSTPSSTAKSE